MVVTSVSPFRRRGRSGANRAQALADTTIIGPLHERAVRHAETVQRTTPRRRAARVTARTPALTIGSGMTERQRVGEIQEPCPFRCPPGGGVAGRLLRFAPPPGLLRLCHRCCNAASSEVSHRVSEARYSACSGPKSFRGAISMIMMRAR
jgi:hypothetical protein